MKCLKKLCFLIICIILLSICLISCTDATEEVTITFTAEGQVCKEYTIAYGKGLTETPVVPAKEGYIGAWSLSDYSEFYENTTITAVYTKNYFTVTFKVDDKKIKETNVDFGTNPILPTIPSKTGHTAVWEITDFTSITKDSTVNAIYTPINMTVTFKNEGEEDVIRNVAYGTRLIAIPSVTLKEGQIGRWDVTSFPSVTENMTVNAVYTLRVLTITLDGADDNTVSSYGLSYGQRLNLPEIQEKEGFYFGGWYYDDGYWNEAESGTVYENTTVYAYWIEINDMIATDSGFFTFALLEDGNYSVAVKAEERVTPANVILPNIHEGKLVTEIADGGFRDDYLLESIEIPVGVTKIGSEAFYGCDELSSIIFAGNNKLKIIGNKAFCGLEKITSISIAPTIEEIGDNAFENCTLLSDLNIPEASALNKIGDYAFHGSAEIETINVSENIVKIGDYAFSMLNSTDIKLLGTDILENVGKFAFENCARLKSFAAPAIINIGMGAFKGCSSLKELTIIGDMPVIEYFGEESFTGSYDVNQKTMERDGDGKFIVNEAGEYSYYFTTRKLPTALATVRINSGIEEIFPYTLYNCFSVSDIYIPSTVKKIGEYAFAAALKETNNTMTLGSIGIADGSVLEEIDRYAFYNRTSFTEITLPSNVNSIGEYAFCAAGNLARINLQSMNNLTFVGRSAFANTNWMVSKQNGVVYLGSIALTFKGISNFASNVNLTLEQGTTGISPYAFSGIKEKLVGVTIPGKVIKISDYAFSECDKLSTVTVEEGVREIGSYAFYKCVGLISILIPKSVETFGKDILRGCIKLNTLNVYGDTIAGSLFGQTLDTGNDSYFYEINQNEIIECGYEITSEEEDVYTVKWTETKNIYGSYPERYNITVSGAVDENGESLDSYTFAYFTHNAYDNVFFEIDEEGVYHFSITLLASSRENNTIRYTADKAGSFFYLPEDVAVGSSISVEARFTGDYYIPVSLKKIVLIEDVVAEARKIAPYAFSNFTSLEEVRFAEGITEIGRGAFENCTALGLKYIAEVATNVTLILPDSLEIIDGSAFKGTANLTEVSYTAASKLTKIGESAFENSGLKGFIVPFGTKIIGERAFADNLALATLQFVDGNGGVTNFLRIRNNAFAGCAKLTNINMPGRLTSLGERAFANCSLLSAVVFAAGSELSSLGGYVFENCTSLTSLIIPEKVDLDEVNFILSGCSGLREITLYNTNTEDYHSATLGSLFSEHSFARSYSIEQNGIIYYVPSVLSTINLYGGKVSARLLENCMAIKIVEMLNITEIADRAFANCTGIEKIELPESVVSIGSEAFYGCSNLISFDITEASLLTEIGGGSFSGNNLLKTFAFPAGIKEISEELFYNCISLETVTYFDIIDIGAYAFYNCGGLTEIILPEGLQTVGDFAFYSCINAEMPYASLTNLKSVGNLAFYNCRGLEIFYAENIGYIGSGAFSGAYNLAEVSIPGNMLLGAVFGGVYYENSYEINTNGTYYIPDSLTKVNISSTAVSIPQNAFSECHSVTDIVFLSEVPPVLPANSFDALDIKLFVPVEEIEVYTEAFADYSDRLYTNPSSYVNFVFTLKNDGTYSIALAEDAVIGEVLVIPAYYEGKAVTETASYAFRNNLEISEVIIPSTIEEIGIAAFYGCDNLTNIKFNGGSKLEIIGDDAFNKCNSLVDIWLPASVKTIGKYAFSNERAYDAGLETYFYYSLLSSITFEEGSLLESIGDYAFYLCRNLQSINLPDTLQTIGKAAFSYSGLTSANIENCNLLTEIAEMTFLGCDFFISVQLPLGIEYIGSSAFENCTSLVSIGFGSCLIEIGTRAFYNASALISAQFPESLTTIMEKAFMYSTKLESIYLSQNVDYIGDYSFNSCTSLYEVITDSEGASYIGEYAFDNTAWMQLQESESDGVIYLNNIVYSYKGDMLADTVITIAEGTVGISPKAFENQSNLTGINIPASLINIGSYAFNNCANLGFVIFAAGSNLVYIGENAFSSTGLVSIALPESTETISDYAFSNIGSLTGIDIPAASSLKEIGKGAFMNLSALDTNIVLPGTLLTIGSNAFINCVNLSITIPEGSNLISIGSKAFSYTKELSVVFPDNITVINDAFSNVSIDTVNLPDHISEISGDAFMNSDIAYVNIGESNTLTEIGDRAFYGLTNTVFNFAALNSLNSIGANAFYGCLGITEIDAKNVSEIKAGAFEGANNITVLSTNGKQLAAIFNYNVPLSLTNIYISAGTTVIDASAFADITSITTVIFSTTVKEISACAFINAENLETLTFEMQESLKTVGRKAFAGTKWLDNKNAGVVYAGKIAYTYKPSENTDVIIAEGTTNIAEHAFAETNITSVTIPVSVSAINEMSFSDCSGLTSLTIRSGSKLKSIGTRAFYNCAGLTLLDLPLSVTEYGMEVFAGAASVSRINYSGIISVGRLFGQTSYSGSYGAVQNTNTYYVPSSLSYIRIIDNSTVIADYCFAGCISIETVYIPVEVKTIGAFAFYNCTGLSVLSVSNGSYLETVGDKAFANCTSLTSITLPLGAVNIGDNILNGTNSLVEIGMNSSLQLPVLFGTEVHDGSYTVLINESVYYLPSTLKTVIIVDGSTVIAERAFTSCNIEYITIPSTINGIGAYAFYNNEQLGVINIPEINSLERIGHDALNGCISLESIILFDSILSIGDRAFYNCTSLSELEIRNTDCEIGEDAFTNTPWLDSQTGDVYIGNTFARYNGIMEAGLSYTVLDGTTHIASEAFKGQTNLAAITIPSTVESFGEGAFEDCTGLATVTFGAGPQLKTISKDAFKNCTSLNSIGIPWKVTEIGESAFYNCTSLTSVMFDIINRLEIIGDFAFKNCGLANISIPVGVKIIGKEAFMGSTGLTSVNIAENSVVEEIGEGAFYALRNTLFNIPRLNSLISAGANAFYGCEKLTDFIAPNVEEYGENVFNECYSLSSLTLAPVTMIHILFGHAENDSEISRYQYIDIFDRSIPLALKTVYMSNKADTISMIEFAECKYITEVYLTENIERINRNAFTNCTGLERIYNTNSLISIAMYAFSNCTKLIASTSPTEAEQEFLLGANLLTIGENAFQNCGSLIRIVLEENSQLESIGTYAFDGAQNAIFEFGEMNKLLTIGENAFRSCKLLTDLFAANLVSCGNDAFSGCSSLESVTVASNSVLGTLFGVNNYEGSYAAAQNGTSYYLPLSLTEVKISAAISVLSAYFFANAESILSINLSGVTRIGEEAFAGLKLTEIAIPASVTSIGRDAFSACAELTEITFALDDTLSFIGEGAFEDTLWYVNKTALITNGIVYIGKIAYACKGTIAGTTELLPGTVSITSGAFKNQSALTVISLPASLTNIGDGVFFNCNAVTTVYTTGNYVIGKLFGGQPFITGSYAANQNGNVYYLPETLENLIIIDGSYQIIGGAYQNAVSLKNITIAKSVNKIGNDIFLGCNGIEEMTVSGSYVLGSLFGYANYDGSYEAVQNGTSYYLPLTLTTLNLLDDDKITGYAYQNAISLETVNINEATTEIGFYAFYGCTSLSSILLNSGINKIGSYAFANCTGITAIILPMDAVFGDAVLSGCEQLITLQASGNNILATLFGTLPYNASYEARIGNKSYYIPQALTTVTLSNVTVIADYCLAYFSMVTTVNIPSNITKIGNYSFYALQTLTGLTLPATLTEVGDYAFYNNKKSAITFAANNITKVGVCGFMNCGAMTKFNSSALQSIGAGAFAGCNSLTEIGIKADKVVGELFGEQLFVNSYKAIQVKSYYIPTALTKIVLYGGGILPEYMFANMTSLTNVTILGETEINLTAFSGCTSITAFACDGLVKLAENALSSMPWLASYIAAQANGIIYIGKVAYACKGTLPLDSVITFRTDTTQLYYNLFENQTKLARVNIIANVKYIAANAFDGCTALDYIDVDDNNPYFSDIQGVLYNKAGTVLIYDPQG